MVNPKYLVINIDWIRYLEMDHHWFNTRFRFRNILETILSKNDTNTNMFLMFNEKEVVWISLEDSLTPEELNKVDIKYLNEIIDDVLCRFYIELCANLKNSEQQDSYIFRKWIDKYSLLLERDDE